jgi:hypothetical protein
MLKNREILLLGANHTKLPVGSSTRTKTQWWGSLETLLDELMERVSILETENMELRAASQMLHSQVAKFDDRISEFEREWIGAPNVEDDNIGSLGDGESQKAAWKSMGGL